MRRSIPSPDPQPEDYPPPPYSTIFPFVDYPSTPAPVQRRLAQVGARPVSICTSSAPETAPISTSDATSCEPSQFTSFDHESDHSKPAGSQLGLHLTREPNRGGSQQILDSATVTPTAEDQVFAPASPPVLVDDPQPLLGVPSAAASDSGMTFQSSTYWHGLGQSFHTDIAATYQFNRSYGVPFEPAGPGLRTRHSADFAFSRAHHDTAKQAELLNSVLPKPIRGGDIWRKTALVICSAQYASVANLSMSRRAISAVETRTKDFLEAWRNPDVVTGVNRGPIIHIHTIYGHGSPPSSSSSSSSSQTTKSYRDILHPAPSWQSFRAESRGAQPLEWARPRDGEHQFFKSINSIFGNGVAVHRVLQWEQCDSVLLAGFDTPGPEVRSFGVSDEDDKLATYTFRSGNDLQESQRAAIGLRFQCRIVPHAYACDVAEERTGPRQMPP